MQTLSFLLNDQLVSVCVPPATPLLTVIREHLQLTACKPACQAGDCGACAVLLGRSDGQRLHYQAVVSCLLPVGAVAGMQVVTLEGLQSETLSPIQQALLAQGAVQCGFCMPGLIIALTGFFLHSPSSDVAEALDAVAGNLCRCTGYAGIKRAVLQLCRQFDLSRSALPHRLADCVAWQLVPAYFLHSQQQLARCPQPEPVVPPAAPIWVAGATDLMVQPGMDTTAWQFLTSPLAHDGIERREQTLYIDAGCSIEALRTSVLMQDFLPSLPEDLRWVASALIRQRASLGGNLAHASPIADLAVMFLALDAQLLVGDAVHRSLPLRAFFTGYKQTALAAGERLLQVQIQQPGGFSFEKVSQRQYLDIASVNSALGIRVQDGCIVEAHLAAGGVAPIPLYLHKASSYLLGKPLCADSVRQAAQIAQSEICPIDDVRGSATYKRLLLRQLLFAHFLKLFPEHIAMEALYATG